MAFPHLPRAVVFDCDGVLIESVDIKTRAFVELFADHPEHAAAIADHHLANLGISRFEKFRWIHRELLRRQPSENELEELGERFSALVEEAACRCPEVPGAGDALSTLHRRGIPLFVASGTPQGELDRVLTGRGWSALFAAVHGSPRSKPQILLAIADALGAPPAELLFVGDGSSDHQAARAVEVPFLWRQTAAQADRFDAYRGPRITDLTAFADELPSLWRRARAAL